MIWFKFAGTAAALLYGSATAFRKKMPLFYKIIYFAFVSCFLGTCYEGLYQFIMGTAPKGFHVGYFGYIGMFFFLFSSYYGAFDSLADGKQKEYWKYRLIPGILPLLLAVFVIGNLWAGWSSQRILPLLFLIPVSGTLYFAGKHLIFPDVEDGIIAAMRPYDGLILALCLFQMADLFLNLTGVLAWAVSIGNTLILAFSLPVARKGVQKWFI